MNLYKKNKQKKLFSSFSGPPPSSGSTSASGPNASSSSGSSSKKKKKLAEKILPQKVRDLVPESQAYMDLLTFERKLDSTIMRKRLDIQEALKRPMKVIIVTTDLFSFYISFCSFVIPVFGLNILLINKSYSFLISLKPIIILISFKQLFLDF